MGTILLIILILLLLGSVPAWPCSRLGLSAEWGARSDFDHRLILVLMGKV